MAPARNGASAVITGLDIAYEERETRSFVRLTLMSLAITAFGVFVAIVALIAIAALGHLGDLLSGAPWIFVIAGKLVSYVALLLAGAAGAATLYSYGDHARITHRGDALVAAPPSGSGSTSPISAATMPPMARSVRSLCF